MKKLRIPKNIIKKHWLLVFALIYFLLPVDVIPDFIPLFGHAEDILFLLFSIFQTYKAYKKENNLTKDILEGEVINE